jgi:hydrogenase expression/formation protein HypC
MCLGLPAQVTTLDTGHPDLVAALLGGVERLINIGVLDEPEAVAPGQWLLVHMGFALAVITEEEARDAMAVFDQERAAVAALAAEDPAALSAEDSAAPISEQEDR